MTLADTGLDALTGARVKRVQAPVGNEPFFLTYGDGVSDVDLGKLLAHHRASGAIGTVTGVAPPGRFGELDLDGDRVTSFSEKPEVTGGFINGGFFVFEPRLFEYLNVDDGSLEADALERLAEDGQLAAFRHEGFWQCMDTLRDKRSLETLWNERRAPWKVWE